MAGVGGAGWAGGIGPGSLPDLDVYVKVTFDRDAESLGGGDAGDGSDSAGGPGDGHRAIRASAVRTEAVLTADLLGIGQVPLFRVLRDDV